MTQMSFWYLPKTSTPTLLAIWWLLTVSLPRNLVTFFLSGFVGMFTLEYRANYFARTRTLSPGIQRLEEDVVKTFPDERRRLEWYMRKAAELEELIRESGIENEIGKELV
jgi:hypothetical protein